MKITIDGDGRIQLDPLIQQHLGLKPGDQVELEPQDDHWTLRPADSKRGLCLKGNVLVHYGTGSPPDDFVRAIREERDQSLMQGIPQ